LSGHDLTLYVDAKFISPYAMSVFVTLIEKKIPFDIETIDLATAQNCQPDYSRLSLTARVPTLTHAGFHLSESSAIAEYLDEAFPAPQYAPVYPRGVHERARARQVQAWLRSDFMPIREERSTEAVFIKPADTPLSEAARAAAARLIAAADTLLRDGAPNLFGDWCIADTDLALMLNRLVLSGGEMPAKLIAYAGHQWRRPSVQQWINRKRQ
jgi:glutathione S-transferase